MRREHFIGKGNFECLDVDVYGWSSPDGKPVSLILYPKDITMLKAIQCPLS
jgi:hypothetical protein